MPKRVSHPDPTAIDVQPYTIAWQHAVGPVEEHAVIAAVWTAMGRTEATTRRMCGLAGRFATRLAGQQIPSLRDATVQHCDAFIWARTRRNTAPSMHTVHLRRSTLRTLYRIVEQLEPGFVDPTRRLTLPAKTSTRPRALTGEELALLRTAALGRARQPLRAAAAVALAETTATTGELPHITWTDVDLDAGQVELPGATPVRARTGHLTAWGTGVLQRLQHTRPDPTDPVLPRRRHGGDPHTLQAAVTNLLARLLDEARLTDPQLRPSSIRLWAGQQVLRRHGIEAAARALGYDSLDRSADALGHRWREQR